MKTIYRVEVVLARQHVERTHSARSELVLADSPAKARQMVVDHFAELGGKPIEHISEPKPMGDGPMTCTFYTRTPAELAKLNGVPLPAKKEPARKLRNSKLGSTQLSMLEALHRHGGYWHSGCGWTWSNHSSTVTLLEGLWRRMLVERTGEGLNTRYTINTRGVEALTIYGVK